MEHRPARNTVSQDKPVSFDFPDDNTPSFSQKVEDFLGAIQVKFLHAALAGSYEILLGLAIQPGSGNTACNDACCTAELQGAELFLKQKPAKEHDRDRFAVGKGAKGGCGQAA